jgi:ADP-heptose:LPS heptosyltransferase
MYRSYPHMDLVTKGIKLPIVQLGGASDIRCKSDFDLCGKLSWRKSAWVMAHAKAAVVIDSFLSHLAGAVGTNAVVLYGPAPARVVGPRAQHGARIINLQPDMLAVCKIMSHCWGGANSQCKSPCIHSISHAKVKKALEELL